MINVQHEYGIFGGKAHRADDATSAAVRLARLFVEGRDLTETMDELLAALPSRLIVDRVLATRAEHALNEMFATPMDMRALAVVHLGVHPVYLSRVFRERWGCSPREYVQRLRVSFAAHELASTQRPLADIALDAGFADQSHMTRVFSRVMRAHRLLSPAATKKMLTAWSGDEGYGWQVNRTAGGASVVHRGGGLPHVSAEVRWYRDDDALTILIMNNSLAFRTKAYQGIERILLLPAISPLPSAPAIPLLRTERR